MKRVGPLVGILAIILVTGCTTDKIILDSTKRPPTTRVDIYKNGKMPDRKFKEITELGYVGPAEEELRTERRFVSQAKKIGGNGLIFTTVNSHAGVAPFWEVTCVFKGKVVVYE